MAGEGTGHRRTGIRRRLSRVGSTLSPYGRTLLQRTLDLFLPVEANVALSEIGDVRRILLVRPNFRLGNALITSPLIPALRVRFPGARLDYLGGEGTLAALDHMPIDERIPISRGFVARPWRFVGLFLEIRRRHYDLAIEGAMGSFSGGLYTWLSGARHRLGVPRRNERFLDVRLPPTPVAHAYDGPVAFAAHLGVACPDHPVWVVTDGERRAAHALLRQRGLEAADGRLEPFAALFVGGHGAKRWPVRQWADLARRLHGEGIRVALFAGPEEAGDVTGLRATLGDGIVVVEPQPLRTFAAVLAAARLVVTPDSGPMHLAAAVGTPVIAVLASRGSTFFGPRGPADVALIEPNVPDVVAAVRNHVAHGQLLRDSRTGPLRDDLAPRPDDR
ncbi:MAG: glycosyltransferase family 9 protein [Deltaproteobacteria bacterium]|nr:glycosyltransferase family 9 protein [Deltaproteobacteria bacterium]